MSRENSLAPAAPGATAPAHADHGGHGGGDGEVHVHIATTRFYAGIFAALIVLTVLTVLVSYYDFGQANIIIALLVATLKAGLVAAFFMHLRHDKLFNTLAFLAAFLFLGIFILLTYDDLGTRGKTIAAYTEMVDPRSGQPAPGGEPATSATANETAGDVPREPVGDGKNRPKE